VGSTFRFTIHVEKGKTKMPQANADAASVADSAGIFAGKRILLVEDVDINREIVVALLADTGIEIDEAANGKIGCGLYRENHAAYDAILMDVHMPEMDGFEATRIIRATGLPGADTIPIIALTANVFREDIESCKAAGMDDHVGKPLDINEVVRTLAQHVLRQGKTATKPPPQTNRRKRESSAARA